MANLFKSYKSWNSMNENEKKLTLVDCASFYEEKALDYILAGLSKAKQRDFKKDPVRVEFAEVLKDKKDVSFGDNIVYVSFDSLNYDKKALFFKVARNTICAVFVHLFYNTASNPKKKTKFASIANGFFASITTEFAKGQEFESDMMQAYAEILGETLEIAQ